MPHRLGNGGAGTRIDGLGRPDRRKMERRREGVFGACLPIRVAGALTRRRAHRNAGLLPSASRGTMARLGVQLVAAPGTPPGLVRRSAAAGEKVGSVISENR